MIVLSDSEEEKDKSRSKDQVVVKRVEPVIDLCSSDEDTPLPSTVLATQPAKAPERPLVTHSQSAGPATQPVRPRNTLRSPADVRPRPRVPVVSKGKLSDARPQPASSRHPGTSSAGPGSGAGKSPSSGGDAGNNISTARRLAPTPPSKVTPNSSSSSRPNVPNTTKSISTPSIPRNVPQTAAAETNSFGHDFDNIGDMDLVMPDDDRGGSLADLEAYCEEREALEALKASNTTGAAPDLSHDVWDNAPTSPGEVDMDLSHDEPTSGMILF